MSISALHYLIRSDLPGKIQLIVRPGFAVTLDKRAEQFPHPIERNSEQAALGLSNIGEGTEVSQTSMGNQMQSGIMLGRRNGDNIPGTRPPLKSYHYLLLGVCACLQ